MAQFSNLTVHKIQYLLLATLMATFAYSMPSFWIGTFSIVIFLLMFFHKPIKWTKLFHEKELLLLFIFILFTYASILWSELPLGPELKTNIGRFKYYFLLIPAIYFANYSKTEVLRLFYILAVSTLPIVISRYTNMFELTNFQALYFGDPDSWLASHLMSNLIIIFGGIFFYIRSLQFFRKGSFKYAGIHFILFLFWSLSILIFEPTESRMLDLTLFALVILTTIYFINQRFVIYFLIFSLTSVMAFVLHHQEFMRGVSEAKKAINEDYYNGAIGWRLGYSIVGFKIFMERPLFGNSINDDVPYKMNQMKITDPKYFKGEEHVTYIHNEHVNCLAQIGIIGYLFLLYLFYLFWKMKIKDSELHWFKNMVLAGYLLAMFGMHYLSLKQSTNLFAIFIVLFVVLKNLTSEEGQN
jgi:hypothetical protein